MIASPPSPPPRSSFVTVLAWLLIATSALLVPVSVLSLLMLLARSYGTASATLSGFLAVVVAPPAALATGIGLLRRRRWAWYATIALLALLIVTNALELLTARAATETHRAASGVETTVTASEPNHHSLPIIVLCAFLLAGLAAPPVRAELGIGRRRVAARPPSAPPPVSAEAPAAAARDWRVGHRGRDAIYYEERHLGGWRRIEIEGEMLMGRAHHAIYFASPAAWRRYPDWARDRRDEIIARVSSEMHPPDYEYDGPGSAGGASANATAPAAAVARQRRALVVAIALLLVIACAMGGIVTDGLQRGATWWPAPRATQQRVVSRGDEPASFWLAIGVYALVGGGSAGLALWMLRTGWRG